MKTLSVWVAGIIALPLVASAQPKHVRGDADAGRALALIACTGCHVVAPDQPFKPEYVGSPHPPDFTDIANKPNVTADSLQHYLQTLSAEFYPHENLVRWFGSRLP